VVRVKSVAQALDVEGGAADGREGKGSMVIPKRFFAVGGHESMAVGENWASVW